MELSPTMQKFVLHWGEMGTRWGVNRTVSQIHALLLLAPGPVHAEEISETLGVARSNVSTSLKELQSWGLVKVSHLIGDRRDHFTAIQDVWEIFRIILEERKRREIDPTLTILRECLIEADGDKRLSGTYDDYKRLSPQQLKRLLKMGGAVAKFLGPETKDEH
jgi:DNA-binding transcriptional regulator GbsR (MarR family)